MPDRRLYLLVAREIRHFQFTAAVTPGTEAVLTGSSEGNV
jgi:hypothetical protein